VRQAITQSTHEGHRRMDRFPRGNNEAHLLNSDVGYEVLDAIVQANIDLQNVSLDELNQMVVQFSTRQHRKAVARLIRDRRRPQTAPDVASSRPSIRPGRRDRSPVVRSARTQRVLAE
jgi:hypothetical protein